VLFESGHPGVTESPAKASTKRSPSDQRLDQLQQELTSSREYLQSIIQDLEAANEELQSANEEILSSNEELQSTNEELDTAKEELQSTNEELNTVNDELNARNDELSYVNSDLVNLLTAVPAAIVIVAADLKIRRFTPLAEQVLNLIPTDVGRPLGDIKPNIDVSDLEDLTREVIETVSVRELAARDRSGRAYVVRIRPYKNQEQRIDGAVLAFVDVDVSNRIDADAAVKDFAQAFLDSQPAHLVLLSEELRVLAAKDTLMPVIGGGINAVRGRLFLEVRHRQWDRPALAAALARLRSTGEPFTGVSVSLQLPRKRDVVVDGQRLGGSNAFPPMLILTVHGVEPAGPAE